MRFRVRALVVGLVLAAACSSEDARRPGDAAWLDQASQRDGATGRDQGPGPDAPQTDGAAPDQADFDDGPPASPQPVGVGGTWDLKFSDEFEGSSLDLTKWHPNWFGSSPTAVTQPVNDAEVSCYDPAQVEVSGGTLRLTAVAATKAGCVKKDGSTASYASGLVMSNGLYNFTYGYVEARIFLPPGTGTPQNWAAFWTDGQNWPQDGEIDIMETLGGGASTRWTYHYDSDTGPGESHAQITAPKSNLIADSGWHVFGAHWQAGKITFYYDGVDVGSVSSNDLSGGASITSSPHYIILNLGLNGSYPVVVPSTMQVDYVRHWQ